MHAGRPQALRNLLSRSQQRSAARSTIGDMTLTAIITLNAVLGARRHLRPGITCSSTASSSRPRGAPRARHAAAPGRRAASRRTRPRAIRLSRAPWNGQAVRVANRRPMRILVIEDEPRILEFLKVGLEAEGFAVDAAEDGVDWARAGTRRDLRARRPRPATARGSTACTCSGAAPQRARAARPDPVGALRPADEAAELRARRERLPLEAVLVRRARRARARPPTPRRVDERDRCVRVGALELDLARRQAHGRRAT